MPGWVLITALEIKADSPEIVITMANGLLLVPADSKSVRFVPPLIVTEAEINQPLSAVKQAFASL